ncbi:K(+) transporting P-type ATPase subunit KdpC [Rhodovastum atsumiense]|uniref:Potassium-transporting ATPase KdpC subunit n=1 Tax=Rhodovastum atsumiense TaxID=504468 RepID=A0A5M6ITZ4_9PROT|nr:K(+)-transporting ATPase subunit C [Rhodovastum atsumiense]KAA5611317.1 K(+)-transporting ATPase subunit C [Rhodovastum atsumiense]CAH2601791.1 K(+) transporting P-type ATPase subunit KdpC [Rhodovastum atsumiense]
MFSQFRPAIVLMLALTVITGIAYPLAVTGIAQAVFPHQANGSLIERDGRVLGSALIGQAFKEDRYFHGRPSATTTTDPNDPTRTVPLPYNAANSGGSNLAPTAKALVERVRDDVAAVREGDMPVPADLVTTSASGLDPDISPAAAAFQVARVAKARGLPEDRVRGLIAGAASERMFGVLGERRVNVLALNLALDALQ